MKILICEDEEVTLTAIEFRLRRMGFDVIKARDGKDALEKFIAMSPDVVIANIQMPHLSGIQLIRHIRSEMKDQTPIIVLTALEEDEAILEALRYGANDFIAKPFRPVELLLRIRRVLEGESCYGGVDRKCTISDF